MSEWHTSSYSPNGGECVEVREHLTGADVRDSIHPEAGHLSFPAAEWAAFVREAERL